MESHSALLLLGAGLAGGVVTAIVGGASLITFPALLAAGLPPIAANASNMVATTPGNLVAGLADLERLPRWNRLFLGLVLVSIAGSVAGALLLLVTPEKAFTAVVPLLIGFATTLFALSDRVRRWILSRSATRRIVSSDGLGLLLFVPVAIYGGYFGAGMSVMLLAILSVTLTGEFRAINVVKNLLAALTGVVPAIVFIIQGEVVAWGPALIMMVGTVLGGFLGGRLVRVLRPGLVRWIVIAVGSILTAVYAWRYWWN